MSVTEKTAVFNLFGSIASHNPASGQRTAKALAKICKVIMQAYQAVGDADTSKEDKIVAVQGVCDLTLDLEWLVSFAKEEADHCRLPEEKLKLLRFHQDLEAKVNVLLSEFRTLRVNYDNYSDVFQTLLGVIEDTKGFMEQGHKTEIAKTADKGANARAEVGNLCNVEYANLLVTAAKMASQGVNEFVESAHSLVASQENNAALLQQLTDAEGEVGAALTQLILATKNIVVSGDTPAARLTQNQAHDGVKDVLAKIQKVVDQVSGRYSSSFNETEEERAARIQMGIPEPEASKKSTGNLLDAARAMADALAGLGDILDGPEEFLSAAPRTSLSAPTDDKKSGDAKGDLLRAAQALENDLASLNTILDM